MNESNKYQEYIELLKANKNLILTGAPGTGKTFLAREIAKAMNAEYTLVQFHPSYDYTDFVEGLRPTPPDNNGHIGFERKDGVFKELCKKAIYSLQNQQENKLNIKNNINSIIHATLPISTTFNDIYQSIIDDIKNRKITKTIWPGCRPYNLDIKKGRIWYEDRFEKEDNIKRIYNYCIDRGKYNIKDWKKDDFWKIVKTVTNESTNTIDYPRYGWILQELLTRTEQVKNQKSKETYQNSSINTKRYIHPDILPTANKPSNHLPIYQSKEANQPYLFIIDEINRGELSKIFGELFFCIDPGYRGKKGLVKTQYQNLITDESDPFYEGFYVPENVYIIGTMNDIDRSVESMDFAMRRRFAWKEVKANENTSMLDELGELKNEVIRKMNRLNTAIWNEETNEGIEGLSAAYHIGGAYFMKLKLYLEGDNKTEAYRKLWENHLRGVLFEYLRGSLNSAENLSMLEKVYYSENE